MQYPAIIHRWLVLAAVAMATAACGDSTSPRRDVVVSLTLTHLDGPALGADENGDPQVACSLHLSAWPNGGETGTWLGAKFRFFFGKDRTTATDSVTVAAREVSDAWGDERIIPGQTVTSIWNAWANYPFAGELEFLYRSSSQQKTVKVPFDCGPPVSPDTPAPTIGPVTFTPSSGELAAGAPLGVSFTANAPAGLWQTFVRVTGPCLVEQRLDEHLQSSQTYQLSLQLPKSCLLGVPIHLDVAVLDGATQLVATTFSPSLVVADHERPTLSPRYVRPLPGLISDVPSGDYFGGDSIQVLPTAGDNHALAAIVWEVLPYGVKDSVVVTDDNVPWSVPVKVHPDWSGPIQLRMWVRDAVGLVSDTVTTPADSLRAHPTIERPTRTATVSGGTMDFVIDSRRGVAYLRQDYLHRIALLSLATMQITSTLSLDGLPVDLDVTPSGDSLLVLVSGHPALGVVDLRQQSLTVSEMPITGLDASTSQMPAHVRAAINAKAYVTLSGTTTASRTLREVDLATGVQRTRTDAGVAGSIDGSPLFRSLDHSVLMLALGDPNCLQRFEVATNTFSPCVSPAVRGAPAIDAIGRRAAIGVDVYDQWLQLLPKTGPPLVLGDVSLNTVLSADGEVLLVSLWSRGIVRLKASDSQILDRTPNTVAPLLMRVSPDGTMLVSIETDFNTSTKVSVIDLR